MVVNKIQSPIFVVLNAVKNIKIILDCGDTRKNVLSNKQTVKTHTEIMRKHAKTLEE
jgi:hypothetical protein